MTRSFWLDIFLSAFSGALLAAAFPFPDISLLAWFGLVPLLLVLQRRPFLCGYAAGITFFGITLYWLNIVMVTYGRLHPFLSLIAYLILVAYLALFFGLSTWLAGRIRQRLDYPYALTLPVIWVAFELLRSTFLTGFPWVLLGYSQHDDLRLIQSADLVGVYGLSGLLILGNAVVASMIQWLADRRKRFRQGRYILLFILLLTATMLYGEFRLNSTAVTGQSHRVSVIQGNIDQSIKWSPDLQSVTVEKYLRLSQEAIVGGSKLVVWPESATPFYLQDRTKLQQRVLDFPGATKVHLLTGSPAYERVDADRYRFYNSAFMISPESQITGRSDKVHLVPFGEYVPFGEFMPFIDKLVHGIGDFSAGKIETLDFAGQEIGVLVCYEAIFPELARSYCRAGSKLLVNITNDAWFGTSSAPYQHLAMARFRAVENRRWLVRSANTGISAFIAPDGSVKSQSGLFRDATLTEPVQFLSGTTFYGRFGDVFPLLFTMISMVWFWQSRLRR
ncbi:MAG: apolipoprotein N-acyltransferase [Desulfuromonas sp.]|nr:MAG: apolipoprotein N-acyltransferase [Desulfuromonas sp.]